ncbi:abscisic acid 8'-hydroxylase 3-like isoform X2 [Zingiber officinale]|uniref:abscisic acid 8'-hydroxylase 3-like isoform X2 n=1 Tax=Zingiber officinale TaxID=94328 RepID=UPI001C4D1D46|nr:abscisic acid 8'-hydroxylase 3-like isoform X2 [Zingiber officinale]
MDLDGIHILTLFSVLVFSVLAIWFRSWKSQLELRNIPGKLGWPLIGETVAFVSDFSSPSGIYSFIKKRQRSYGRVFKTSVLGRFTIFMTGREASRFLLSGKDGVVSLNLSYAGKQVLGPSSLLTTAGEDHRQLRRLIGEPLSVESLKKNVEFINHWAINALEEWQSGRRVLVLEEASAVITNMIMSLAPTGEEQEKFRANFKLISATFASLPFKIPGTAFHRGIQARNRMYEMLDRMIAKRRSGEEVQDDFLQSLLRKHSGDDEDSEKLSDAQLKDNILTLLVAGHDTTTAALTWFIKFLGDNPDVLQNLREEHLQIQNARRSSSSSNSDHVTWSEVNSMAYTNKVISETLRKATILPWFSRKAAEDFTIDGYEIKKDWAVNLDVVSMHHDPSVFPDPEKFDPSRFDMPLKPYSFLGFGHGPRMCPGMHLAKLEICIFMHHFLCRYKWESLDEDESLNPTLVRMPKNKYPIAVEQL